MKFNKNDSFSHGNSDIKIVDILGKGGQGEVYLVKQNNQDLAFKIYSYDVSDDFRFNIKNNIRKGSPSSSFLWPKEFIEFTDGDCGYLMDLRPKEYQSFISYLTGNTHFKSYRLLLNWCIELVDSFKKLHENGYSYQDLNDGSFFLNPENGKLLICDNDNVTADGRNLGVLGKMRYMAPEIVRGDKDRFTGKEQMPDVHSDRFSLAVILFLALCKGNPFEGECLKKYVLVDEKAEYEMFGSHPVYIFNENDQSNRPIRGYHTAVLKRFPSLPSYIKEAFHKTFVDGLKDRENGRTTEIEWIKLLCKYRDELITCKCGEEYAYGFDEKKPNDRCPNCKRKTRDFCVFKANKSTILLEPNKYIYEFHIDKFSSKYSKPVGKVIINKNNPSLWGIQLKLNQSVTIEDINGRKKTIAGDGVIPIINNLKVYYDQKLIGTIYMKK
ncbi:MAG: hypothetical protein K5765_01180 [Clostridia bacterium]|nr:hypothetical protein [Clostridia bacterium]